MDGLPLSLRQPIPFAGPLPAQAEFVIIGGGVIGVCTALYLARGGHDVVLLEKGRVAAEQSCRNWGWIRQQGRDPAELPIMVEANRLWRELAGQTATDIGLRQGGVVYLAETEAELARFADWLKVAQGQGVDTRLLSSREAAALLPGAARGYKGALYTASDMRAEPWVAVPALAGLARQEGARIIEGCAVRCLDMTAGAVSGVVTETGLVRAGQVILCGGAWSSLFLANHGVSLPQLSVRATVAATSALPEVFPGGAADQKIAFRRRIDGGYTLAAAEDRELFIGPSAFRAFRQFLQELRRDPMGTRFRLGAPKGYPDGWLTPRRWDGDMETPFERMRVLDPAPNPSKIEKTKTEFSRLYPGLPRFQIRNAWAGMIDTMPDLVPVVDRIAAVPGLTLATGMSGHGFGIGPGIGRVLSALVTGQPVGHDLERFRFGRFAGGSAVSPVESF